jgi:hypothetical protein
MKSIDMVTSLSIFYKGRIGFTHLRSSTVEACNHNTAKAWMQKPSLSNCDRMEIMIVGVSEKSGNENQWF